MWLQVVEFAQHGFAARPLSSKGPNERSEESKTESWRRRFAIELFHYLLCSAHRMHCNCWKKEENKRPPVSSSCQEQSDRDGLSEKHLQYSVSFVCKDLLTAASFDHPV